MAGPGAGVMILECGDDDRVPTEEEVAEYAEYLSIDPKTEPHLLWIAAEGVVAAVPAPWKACTENGDDVFYFNFETGESIWDHPCDEKYRLLAEESRKSQAAEEPRREDPERRREEKRLQAREAERRRLKMSDSEDSDESALTDEAMMAPLVGVACQPYSRDLPSLCTSMDVPTMASRDLPPMASRDLPPMRSVAEQEGPFIDQRASRDLPQMAGRGLPMMQSIEERSRGVALSSNISEVSEDVPSDVDGPSEAQSQARFSIGDSLEFSSTMQDFSMASVLPNMEAARASPPARLLKAQDELASLERALIMLEKIRGQQREYLQMLKPEGCL